MSDYIKRIREKIKCCACSGSLADSKEINVICLMKEAEWKHPTWGNVILGIYGFATAILCDKCLRKRKKPKWALEWDERTLEARYHPVKRLKDVPREVFYPLDELEPGRHGIAG